MVIVTETVTWNGEGNLVEQLAGTGMVKVPEAVTWKR